MMECVSLNTPAPPVAKEDDEHLDTIFVLEESRDGGLEPDLVSVSLAASSSKKNKSSETNSITFRTELKKDQTTAMHFKSRDNLFGSKASFWKCVSHPAYADINIVFKDGILPINRSIMASISQNIWINLDETHDCIVIPDLAIQNFYDLIFIFAEDSIKNFKDLDASCFSDGFHETIRLLGVNLFKKTEHFNSGIDRLKIRLKEAEKHRRFGKRKCETRRIISDPSYNLISLKRKNTETNLENNFGKNLNKVVSDEEISDDEGIKKKGKIDNENSYIFADLEVDDSFKPSEEINTNASGEFMSCDECGMGFQNEKMFVQHLSESHSWDFSSVVRCVFCNCLCRNIQSVVVHEQQKCKNNHNSCHKCKQEFETKNDLLKHLVQVHKFGAKKWCEHCNKHFLVLVAHNSSWPHPQFCSQKMLKRSLNIPQECEDCGKFFKNKSRHKKVCVMSDKNTMKHECYECGRKFRKLASVKRHFLTYELCKNNSENVLAFPNILDHSKGRTTCADCGCDYITRKGHQEHKKKCSAFTAHKCHACGRGINALNGFHIHFNNFPDCKEDPRNANILKEIGNKSLKAKKHVCYMCGASYKMKEWLEKHMVTHAGQVEYFACKEDTCKIKFITEKAVELHMAAVHPDAKGECFICNQLIPRGQLKAHILNHAVKCSHCDKIFSHKGVLDAHFEAVHGPREKKKKAPRKRKPRPARPEAATVPQLLPEVHGLVHQDTPQDLRPMRDVTMRDSQAAMRDVTQAMRDPSQAIVVAPSMAQLGGHHVLHGPLQTQYQPHTMIATIPTHAHHLNANQIQHFLQINAQTRYQN